MRKIEFAMPGTVSSLVLDLVQWAALKPRSHAEFVDAWRSSCPRLTIWEDAEELGLIERRPGGTIAVTAKGRACLDSHGRMPDAAPKP